MAEVKNPYYTVRQIDEHTWHIEDYFHDYMYLVEGSKKAAVIDTGMGFKGLRAVAESLTDKPLIALNTHGHLDHVGANAEFDEVYINLKDEALMREHGSESYRKKDIPAFIAEVGADLKEEAVEELICLSSDYPVKPLSDGQSVDLGGRVLKVIEVPGHTRGSVVFLDEASKMLFSGDMMCTMGVMLSFDCSTTVSEFIESIKKMKKETDGKVAGIYPGHHVLPITVEYYDKYIECAQRLLRDSTGAVTEHGTFGTFYRFWFEDISLTYVDRTLK